ncbi:MAG: MFS transporter [Paludibacteraceae bacterium]|nr:MFS transporter [Paludibacteraceae bacterium]
MTKEQRTRQGVFWAVTIGYGLFYVCRLSISVLKKGIIDDGFLTESELGIIGSALFFGYAVGKLFNGFLADHINVRYFMSAGLLICAIINAVLALKVPFIVFVILWAINGWFQSVGAPCSIISLKRWFGNDGFGTKYGYWSLSHNLGEAITFYVTALIVGALGWQAGFLGAAGMGLLGVVLIFGLLRPFQATEEQPAASTKERIKETGSKQLAVLKMPIIWVLALASAFMYMARYAFTSWGIFYFQTEKGYSVESASFLLMLSSACGIVGTVGSGLVSDKVFGGDRTLMAFLTSLINLLALTAFLFVPAGFYWADCIIVVLFGLSIGVLICFLGGLMAVDIAPAEAAGATAGVIGMASYAAAGLQDIVSGYLIEGRKVMVDVMEDGVIKQVAQYDFSAIRLFWIAAGTISLALLIYIYIHARRHPQPKME